MSGPSRHQEAIITPGAAKTTTPVSVDAPIIERRYAELDHLTVAFETFPVDVDAAPWFAGLRGRPRRPRCSSPMPSRSRER
ncbi:hypothetical protein [Gordonia sp. NB41Y]|uniref:hypothetical protein n=1 Tax=Gordonia sp. NB41Y TaxID=875808 RepID=UPI0002BFF513|nr:hypothetical protein [Gordonia sp. NB41Y]EMP13260.1 hypothetical protein ISGA_4380 [Gordonia sp. NB41Y]WLP88958.1 hypothetical protein Q9K23_15240 [Gordonia sp. NB41Y]